MMKPLNCKEIAALTAQLNKLCGSHLQSFTAEASKLYMLFWDGRRSNVWLLDLRQKCPVILPFNKNKPKKNQYKPWSLFLKSHFLGSRLLSAQPTGLGERCVQLNFASSQPSRQGSLSINIRLFPGGVNLILDASGKTVSYLKPKAMKPAGEPPPELLERSVEKIVNEYFSLSPSEIKKTSTKNIEPLALLARQISKKQKAIVKLQQELVLKQQNITSHLQLGQNLKSNLSHLVPDSLQKYYDPKKTPLQNMQRAFELHKKEKAKLAGTEKRLLTLQHELSQLQAIDAPDAWAKEHFFKQGQNISGLKLKKNKTVKYKTIRLNQDYKLYIGSSAKDNSELIKSSRPWYTWLHLRDYPSSHAVVISDKKKSPPLEILTKAGLELLGTTFGVKKKNYIGIKFDIVYCEIRHLKLLKGSVGKVTYTNNKNLTVVCN